MMQKTRAVFVIFILCLLGARGALAELMIEITKGSDSALPIAVVPFGSEGERPVPEDVARNSKDV